jgi:hypothetical protein
MDSASTSTISVLTRSLEGASVESVLAVTLLALADDTAALLATSGLASADGVSTVPAGGVTTGGGSVLIHHDYHERQIR